MYLPVDRLEPSDRRSTTARARLGGDDRFVYGRLTPAADPYRSRTSRSSDRGMEQRHERLPSGAQHGHQRGRCDHGRGAVPWPCDALGVARRASSAPAPSRARARARRRAGRTRRRGDRRAAPGGGAAPACPARRARRAAGGRSRRLRSDPDGARARSRPAARSRRAGRAHTGDGRRRSAVTSSRKKSSVKRPGCSFGPRSQPRNSSRHAIQRRVP